VSALPAAGSIARTGAAAVVADACGCASALPPEGEFASVRCATVYQDGVDGAPTIEIGAIIGLQREDGSADHDGTFQARAMQLAIAELNNNRYIAGKRLRMTVCDTRADWSVGGGQVTRDLARWLISERKVQVIVTDASSDTQTALAVTRPAGVLIVAVSATAAELTKVDDDGLLWRVAPSDVYQAAVLAHVATDGLAPSAKVSAFAAQNPYGDGVLKVLTAILADRLVAHTFAADGKGLDIAVKAAANDGSGAVVLVGSTDHALAFAKARATLPAIAALPVFAADGACDARLAEGWPTSGGPFSCTRPGQSPTTTYNQFRSRFQQRFGADPGDSPFSPHAFDAVYVVALAHAWAFGANGGAKGGIASGKALAAGLSKLHGGPHFPFTPGKITDMVTALGKGEAIDVEGASGRLDFNAATGEAPSDYALVKVEGGKLKTSGWFSVKDGPAVSGKETWVVAPAAP